MFTINRKLHTSSAPSPAPKPASQRAAKAPNPLWFRLATSRNAGSPASAAGIAVQRKETLSSPGDAYEREADEAADKVMRMAGPGPIGSAPAEIQRKCAACAEEEKEIQTKPATSARSQGTLDTGAAVRAAARGGEALPGALLSYFEPRFGHDFSQVRVHTDGAAADAAQSVHARAYTVGSAIVFGAGQYSPDTPVGKRLLAHELAHVVQQGGASHAPEGPTAQMKQVESSDGPLVQRVTISCVGGMPKASDCALQCLGSGMTCLPLAKHPYRPTAGWGFLTVCSNDGGGPFYTCGYVFKDGDVCVQARPFGLPTWTCTGPTPQPKPNAAESVNGANGKDE